jgi:magnesium transporter
MLTIIRYHAETSRELSLKEFREFLDRPEGTVWVDMIDPNEAEEETVLLSLLGLHPLAIEDCRREKTGEGHLPKVEDFGEYLFVIFNPIRDVALAPEATRSATAPKIETTQLSAFITSHVLVTHHYLPLAAVDHTLGLCRRNPRVGVKGPDYLFHLIIDAVVDAYSPVLDRLDLAVDQLEDEVFRAPSQRTMTRVLQIKKDIMTMRRIAVYQREMLSRLSRGEFPLITADEMVYYRNVYDHLVRMSDVADSYRDIVSGLLDAYLSVTSNRLNQIMKVLTIISTIFLPLSFITGFFGMNFRVLPFSEWEWGVGVATLIMAAVGIGMLWLFRRNKWL